jgi:hypothetical protein
MRAGSTLVWRTGARAASAGVGPERRPQERLGAASGACGRRLGWEVEWEASGSKRDAAARASAWAAGPGGASKRGARAGGAGCSAAEAGGDVEGRRQSRACERLRCELMRRDAGELASSEHGSWSGMVYAVQELACWRAGAGAGAAGTWAAPSEWRERARGGMRELAVWAGVQRLEKSGPMGTSRRF